MLVLLIFNLFKKLIRNNSSHWAICNILMKIHIPILTFINDFKFLFNDENLLAEMYDYFGRNLTELSEKGDVYIYDKIFKEKTCIRSSHNYDKKYLYFISDDFQKLLVTSKFDIKVINLKNGKYYDCNVISDFMYKDPINYDIVNIFFDFNMTRFTIGYSKSRIAFEYIFKKSKYIPNKLLLNFYTESFSYKTDLIFTLNNNNFSVNKKVCDKYETYEYDYSIDVNNISIFFINNSLIMHYKNNKYVMIENASNISDFFERFSYDYYNRAENIISLLSSNKDFFSVKNISDIFEKDDFLYTSFNNTLCVCMKKYYDDNTIIYHNKNCDYCNYIAIYDDNKKSNAYTYYCCKPIRDRYEKLNLFRNKKTNKKLEPYEPEESCFNIDKLEYVNLDSNVNLIKQYSDKKYKVLLYNNKDGKTAFTLKIFSVITNKRLLTTKLNKNNNFYNYYYNYHNATIFIDNDVLFIYLGQTCLDCNDDYSNYILSIKINLRNHKSLVSRPPQYNKLEIYSIIKNLFYL